MSDFTQVNLKQDVENASEKFGLAPDMEARFARNALGLEGGGFSYQKLAPNFRGPFGHRHERQEEVYVVVGGSGRIKVGDDVHDLSQWDAVRIPAQTARGFEAGADGLELIAIGFGDGGDAEIINEFWND
jgi:mannose-6-phosphate isomerase-like protein (cupin superfamily)